MEKERIFVSGPSITEKEVSYVTDAAKNAWYADAGMYHERFEKAFSEYIGMKYAVALPSCTSAIHLAYLALGVGSGDEVIVPETTWIGTSAPLKYIGAKPVFVDIDRTTWCIDPASMERAITEKTKAIATVDLYGGIADYDAIDEVAKKYGIPVMEDAAQAMGVEYRGKKAGSFGKIGVFSFHGSKTMTTGEGGMLLTDDEELYEKVKFLHDQGRKRGDPAFMNREVAYKYKMSSMQAALGLAQLERIEEIVAAKREHFRWYKEELSGMNLTMNYEPPGVRSTYWMVTLILDENLGKTSMELQDFLKEANIDSRPFFYPLSFLPAYRDTEEARGMRERNPVSYELAPLGINLPSGMDLTRAKVARVSDKVREFLMMANMSTGGVQTPSRNIYSGLIHTS